MPDQQLRPLAAFPAFLIREATVLTVIVLNTVVLLLDAFPAVHARTHGLLFAVDYGCMVFFVTEAAFKIWHHSFRGYWRSAWNKLDFVIVVASLPILVTPFVAADLDLFSVILLGRFLRFLRVMRFIPNATEIWKGITRSLKASIGIFLVLFVLNLILAMGANILFGEAAPQYFGDPLIAFYSLFKVFTIEGWYEIPEALAASGQTGYLIVLLRMYFVGAVLVGGILGLSLANAVLVDEMTMDNTAKVEALVHELRADLAAQQARDDARWNEVQRLLQERR